MRCGLLGEKLGHSYSPQIHAQLGDYTYELFEKSPEELRDFLLTGQFDCINVTIPYKKAVIPYCTKLSHEAEILGSVNTIIKNHDGTLTGHNTDYFGFQFMLKKSGLHISNKKVLVLGSGGAAATVHAVLAEAGAFPVIISRHGENNYQNLHRHKDAAVIVNATPVGMYPNNGLSPLSVHEFPELTGVLDLIYNPARTQLLQDAESRGFVTCNGLWMLVAQAKKAAELFTGEELPDDIIDTVYHTLSKQMQNTVLIGMPGCGKSTIGKLLATQLHKEFVDSDACIELLAGKTIPEIFREDGESAFRALETQILEELGRRSGLVIATGGGCVTQRRNYPLLHQNSHIVWIKRALSLLPTDGRPLSQSHSPESLYLQREPLYSNYADHIVHNNDAPEKTAALIAELEDSL